MDFFKDIQSVWLLIAFFSTIYCTIASNKCNKIYSQLHLYTLIFIFVPKKRDPGNFLERIKLKISQYSKGIVGQNWNLNIFLVISRAFIYDSYRLVKIGFQQSFELTYKHYLKLVNFCKLRVWIYNAA